MIAYLIVTVVLFYFLALLQVSFLSHFHILGTAPNIIFIFYLLLVFFDTSFHKAKYDINVNMILWSLVAGTLLDMFSYTYFGFSVVLLLIIGFFVKKIQLSLMEQHSRYPFVHFLIIFVSSFVVYQLCTFAYTSFNTIFFIDFSLTWRFIVEILYNTVAAAIGFYVIKQIMHITNGRKKV